MKLFAVRDLYESFARANHAERSDADRRKTNKAFTAKVMGLVAEKKLKLEDFSFKDLWEGLVVGQDLEEVAVSSAFPNISGEILSAALIEGYNSYPTQADALVRTKPSRMKTELSAGWTPVGTIREVKERADYLEIDAPDEKAVLTPNKKYGGIISLTREAITFDQTAQLVSDARDIGAEGRRFREQLIMEGVIDKNSNVYNKTTLYSAGNGNLLTGAGSVLGTAGFEACYIAAMKKTDERGKKIWVPGAMPTMMVPPDLLPTAFKLKNNEYGPNGTALGNDKNFAFNKFDIVVNPYQTVATRWHLGDFKRQFVWFEVWPVETFYRTGQDSDDGFERDIILQAKVSFFGGVGALDTKYVDQNNGV